MKRILIASLLLLSFLTGCKDTDRTTGEPENDIDAARDFIRAALDGDYDKARTYLMDDSLSHEDLDASERLYKERMTPEEKNKYKGASIRIYEKKVVDSVTSIIYFSNTYRNQRDSLKVIKTGDKWLVDFKYIFKHKSDSL
jgi:Domain of unknown function (DUF4878)